MKYIHARRQTNLESIVVNEIITHVSQQSVILFTVEHHCSQILALYPMLASN